MAGHKKQHFVPRVYLKAWCDPATPKGQEPYVWVFSKDGTHIRRKSPANLFAETDLYTIRAEDSSRNLVLERGLSQLEGEFASIRDTCLERTRMLSHQQHAYLCAFVAAARARTPALRDHISAQWGRALAMMDSMREWAKTATPEQKLAVPRIGKPANGQTLSYDEVKSMVDQPLQTMLRPSVDAQLPILLKMDLALLVATGSHRFITSDSPCVWLDPEAYKRPPMYRAPGLAYPTIEVSLPVSPRQLILLNWRGADGYFPAEDSMVDECNRVTRFHCVESFVNFENATLPVWFDPGIEPKHAGTH